MMQKAGIAMHYKFTPSAVGALETSGDETPWKKDSSSYGRAHVIPVFNAAHQRGNATY